jgi:SAM-dependent methyltransferase
VLLGVTPELALLPLPRGSKLQAVERVPEMIAQVWPREALAAQAAEETTEQAVSQSAAGTPQHPLRFATVGTWQALPYGDASVDLVLGDRCFTALRDEQSYDLLCTELRRVLRPGGLFLHRFFIQAEKQETTAQVQTALLAGEISSFEVFRWRFAMALTDPVTHIVDVRRIWDELCAAFADGLSTLESYGFKHDVVSTLAHYRDSPARYSFLPRKVLERHLRAVFSLEDVRFPKYELGERCPLVVCRKT